MFIEGSYAWTAGYIGGTWDSDITLFQLGANNVFQDAWASAHAYVINDAVVAIDGNVYTAVVGNTNVDPTLDDGTHWLLAPFFDLTGYSAVMPVGPIGNPLFTLTSASGGGLTLGGSNGTIVMQATPAQTFLIPKAGTYRAYVQLTDPNGNIYYPLGGSITFNTP